MPQDNFLFSTTIKENIAFSNPGLDDEVIYEASRLSSIHEDILAFSEGYETVVGERGVSLSGGQKQRISIARAIITDPEVLILDDSLSAVDAQTEVNILQNISRVREGKTNIITAHRISAVSKADLIIVMDAGTVVERGTHKALLEAGGWYYETHRQQALRQNLTDELDNLVKGDESHE